MPDDLERCIFAAGAIDAAGVAMSPALIQTLGDSIVSVEAGDATTAGSVGEVIHRPDCLVLPALVNAHSHLDLTDIGPRPYGGDFIAWIHDIVKLRSATDDDAVADAVRRGVELARRGGTGLIGDIAGGACAAAVEALRSSGLPGVSYFEVFGQGAGQQRAIETMRAASLHMARTDKGVVLGLSPHTPFSCGMDVFRAAASMDLPICTHLAETLEELEFVRSATGPFAELLQTIWAWDDTILPSQRHAVDVVLDAMDGRPMLAAHLNYVEDDHLRRLAKAGVSVAYCPRASEYFEHPRDGRPPHRYREMLEAGVNVTLGTDSIICLDTPGRISVLDEMRRLYQRDRTDPQTLLRMATINGARALGFNDQLVRLTPGRSAGLIALPARGRDAAEMLRQVMESDEQPEWLLQPHHGSPVSSLHQVI